MGRCGERGLGHGESGQQKLLSGGEIAVVGRQSPAIGRSHDSALLFEMSEDVAQALVFDA